MSERHLGIDTWMRWCKKVYVIFVFIPPFTRPPKMSRDHTFISRLFFAEGLMGSLPLAQRRTNPIHAAFFIGHSAWRSSHSPASAGDLRSTGMMGLLELSYVDYRLWSPGFCIMITRYFRQGGPSQNLTIGGGNSIFIEICYPEPWRRFPFWQTHMFQTGWFNHQLVDAWTEGSELSNLVGI